MKRMSFIVEDVADRTFRVHKEGQDAVGDVTVLGSMVMAASKAASVLLAPARLVGHSGSNTLAP